MTIYTKLFTPPLLVLSEAGGTITTYPITGAKWLASLKTLGVYFYDGLIFEVEESEW